MKPTGTRTVRAPRQAGARHNHVPNSLSYALDELTQSFHRPVCGMATISMATARWTSTAAGTWGRGGPLSYILPYQDWWWMDWDHLFPEAGEESAGMAGKSELPYEELWAGGRCFAAISLSLAPWAEKTDATSFGSVRSKCVTSPLPVPGSAVQQWNLQRSPYLRSSASQIRSCKSFLFWGVMASSVSLLSPHNLLSFLKKVKTLMQGDQNEQFVEFGVK